MIVSLPDGETKHYSLDTDKVQIGRGGENQITIPVDCVSSRHCEILRDEDGQFFLVDLGSKNGTEINGAAVPEGEKVVLGDGDFVLFGQSVYAQMVSVSRVGADDGEAALGKALAALSRNGSARTDVADTAQPDSGEKVGKADSDRVDLDREFEEMAINPVAAAVAKATRAFTSE